MDQTESHAAKLSSRFEQALQYAARLHAGQERKGTGVPYVAHLMSVAALVLEDGGDEDEAIAALLHDAVEDQGGQPTLEQIRRRFGQRVARIVEGCTDTDASPKPPWRRRKEQYLAHLRHASTEMRRVSSADKLHNARTVLAEFRQVGDSVWQRFQGDKEGTLWYYRSLVTAFREGGSGYIVEELDRVVTELEGLASP